MDDEKRTIIIISYLKHKKMHSSRRIKYSMDGEETDDDDENGTPPSMVV